jgi:phosphohistidine swiveling domain-containing protein
MTPRFSDYKPMFKVRGKLTCLHTEMLMTTALGEGHPVCLYRGEQWDTYLSLEGEKRCNAKGAELLGDPESYWRWASELREYIKKAHKEIIPRFAGGIVPITEAEVRELIPDLRRFQDFYGTTDFPYSEGMYQRYEETKDPRLAEAMEDFGRLKFEARDILNAYMHNQGVYPTFLGSIASQFGLAPEDGQFLFSEDIDALFANKTVDAQVLKERREYYGCGFDGTFHIFSDMETRKYWEEFHPALTVENELKGTIANKGKATGRVVIAPMLTDPKAIMRVVEKMQDGDVLVAESTTPEFVPLCKKASAIVTDQGGMLSHAAVVSREMRKPCIIGTQRATRVFKDGDLVEVDAEQGVVRRLGGSGTI